MPGTQPIVGATLNEEQQTRIARFKKLFSSVPESEVEQRLDVDYGLSEVKEKERCKISKDRRLTNVDANKQCVFSSSLQVREWPPGDAHANTVDAVRYPEPDPSTDYCGVALVGGWCKRELGHTGGHACS